jgi:peroxiredoxin
LHDKGFILLAVNATNQDKLENARSFVQANQLTFPILLDTNGEVSQQYRLTSLPTSFFIRSDGIIDEVVVGGPMTEASLRARLERLLKEGN